MTREEIIKNLKYTMEKHKNDNVSTFGTNISVMCKDILDYLEQESRWIPVSEMVPTKEEYIANNGLFIVSDGNRTYVEYFAIYKSIKCFCTMNGFRVDRCVTAWMTLPKSYKPQESEDKK